MHKLCWVYMGDTPLTLCPEGAQWGSDVRPECKVSAWGTRAFCELIMTCNLCV